jgi:hypothetical protein
MHKYNNQDHAMMTAMLCVKNILAGTELYDLWQVNGDAEYHEGGRAPVRGRRFGMCPRGSLVDRSWLRSRLSGETRAHDHAVACSSELESELVV